MYGYHHYYEAKKGIKICWNPQANFECDECGDIMESGSWVDSFSSSKYISKDEVEIITRRTKLTKGKIVNHIGLKRNSQSKEQCTGKYRFYGWTIWAEDCRKEKSMGMFSTGTKTLETTVAKTLKERKKLVNKLLKKYGD